MYRELISQVVEGCKSARDRGAGPDEIRDRVLPENLEALKNESGLRDFLEWVKEDREYSSYYFDVRQSGACAKPAEIAALILEEIVFDSI
ncbi:MAG TPA: hypothetical protein VNH22_03070 [Blastocatellia bacterium]|jgi:hypothetical protein|nr:hypothetical protein [Blastocatellia bacterium]